MVLLNEEYQLNLEDENMSSKSQFRCKIDFTACGKEIIAHKGDIVEAFFMSDFNSIVIRVPGKSGDVCQIDSIEFTNLFEEVKDD